MRDVIILVFANKQDIKDGKIDNLEKIKPFFDSYFLFIFFLAMKPAEIQDKLGLTMTKQRNWFVQPACALTGDGLHDGLTWLMSNHK